MFELHGILHHEFRNAVLITILLISIQFENIKVNVHLQSFISLLISRE